MDAYRNSFLIFLAHFTSPHSKTCLFSKYPSSRGLHINSVSDNIAHTSSDIWETMSMWRAYTQKIKFPSSPVQDDRFQSWDYQGHLQSRPLPWEQQMLILRWFHCIFVLSEGQWFLCGGRHSRFSFLSICIFCENDVLWELFQIPCC